MLPRRLIDTFWAKVSLAVDAPSADVKRLHEDSAISAFADIIYFCEAFDLEYTSSPVSLAIEFATIVSNDFQQEFDLEKTLPQDMYKRGIELSRISVRQYQS